MVRTGLPAGTARLVFRLLLPLRRDCAELTAASELDIVAATRTCAPSTGPDLVRLFASWQGLPFPAERMSQLQTVGAEAILDNVFSLGLAAQGIKRPAERRMVGFCHHFALLQCALRRATDTPAATTRHSRMPSARRWRCVNPPAA